MLYVDVVSMSHCNLQLRSDQWVKYSFNSMPSQKCYLPLLKYPQFGTLYFSILHLDLLRKILSADIVKFKFTQSQQHDHRRKKAGKYPLRQSLITKSRPNLSHLIPSQSPNCLTPSNATSYAVVQPKPVYKSAQMLLQCVVNHSMKWY